MASNPLYRDRPLLCSLCGTAFIGTHPRSKYCSPQCAADVQRARHSAKRAANPEHFRSIAKNNYVRHREAIIAKSREFGRSERGRELQRQRSAKRRVTEKQKVDARTKLNNALRYGRVVRGPCRDCGATETHGHHHDYSKPLDVIWLCQEHHIAEHRRISNAG